MRIGIIVGSTRPGRKAPAVAEWAHEILKGRRDAEYEIVDVQAYELRSEEHTSELQSR